MLSRAFGLPVELVAPFQSSPALTGGCYPASDLSVVNIKLVSILTRPYGRMLWRIEATLGKVIVVSILTRPYGRMLYRATDPPRP